MAMVQLWPLSREGRTKGVELQLEATFSDGPDLIEPVTVYARIDEETGALIVKQIACSQTVMATVPTRKKP